jgi:tight adherence protein C
MLIAAVFLLASAFVLNEAKVFGRDAGYAARRLARIVPAPDHADAAAAGIDYGRLLTTIFRVIDPSFSRSESAIRYLGIARPIWIAAIEGVKFLVAAISAALCSYWAAPLLPYPGMNAIAPLIAGAGGLFGTSLVVESAARTRQRMILGELTLGIELLTIFLEAGQSLDQAFRSFSSVSPKALPRIVPVQRALVSDIANGVSYERALEHWVERLGVEQARALASLFMQSLVHGIELVPVLRQFSADLVEQRMARARASIGTKSAQLTCVMIVFFLPAILVFIIAPAIAALVSGLELQR